MAGRSCTTTEPLNPCTTPYDGSPWSRECRRAAVEHLATQRLGARVRVGRQHLGQHRSCRSHRERVAVERADLVVAAVGDRAHHLGGAADRAARHAAAERLRQTDDVGGDAEQLGRATPGDDQPGLDLVERQQRTVAGA